MMVSRVGRSFCTASQDILHDLQKIAGNGGEMALGREEKYGRSKQVDGNC
jgi:hypothetical protein